MRVRFFILLTGLVACGGANADAPSVAPPSSPTLPASASDAPDAAPIRAASQADTSDAGPSSSDSAPRCPPEAKPCPAGCESIGGRCIKTKGLIPPQKIAPQPK